MHYGKSCVITRSPVNQAPGYNQQNADNSNANAVQQQAVTSIPGITATQLSDMLLEVSRG